MNITSKTPEKTIKLYIIWNGLNILILVNIFSQLNFTVQTFQDSDTPC